LCAGIVTNSRTVCSLLLNDAIPCCRVPRCHVVDIDTNVRISWVRLRSTSLFQKVSNSTATNLFAAKKVESLIWSRLTRPRPEPSVGVGGGKSGLARKNISPSEYLSAPSEEMMKEKLVVKLATSRVLFSQRSMVSEYVARPQLSTAFGVSWMTEPEIVAFPVSIIG
jgi:hypothetical protein